MWRISIYASEGFGDIKQNRTVKRFLILVVVLGVMHVGMRTISVFDGGVGVKGYVRLKTYELLGKH